MFAAHIELYSMYSPRVSPLSDDLEEYFRRIVSPIKPIEII